MIYNRITIDTLIPLSMRTEPPDPGGYNVTANQHPVSDWIEDIREWWDLSAYLIRCHPVTRYGLIYGRQTLDDEQPFPLEERLAEIKADVMGVFERQKRERETRQSDAVRRVVDFLATFPVELYAVVHVAKATP